MAKSSEAENVTDQETAESTRRWSFQSRRTRLALLSVAFVAVFLTFVGPISLRKSDGPAPVLPNTDQQFSLDLKVIGSLDHDVIYAVEQRARPKYRIFAFDPSTGKDTTVFTVPTDAIIYGIALSPDRNTLAVSYSPDFRINGSGISLLNLESKKLTEVTAATKGVFRISLEWAKDASAVYSSRVDQSQAVEKLDITRTSIADGSEEVAVPNAVGPTFSGDRLYYLRVDENRARRSIGVQGSPESIAVGEGKLDLDHLIGGPDESSLRVSAITPDEVPAITVGTPAAAHGNHNVPSSWWNVSANGSTSTAPIGLAQTVVYDASSRGESIVYATLEGISIAVGSTKTDLIASRAIRLVAT